MINGGTRILWLLFGVPFLAAALDTRPEVHVSNGHLIGVFKKSRNGCVFASFTRIPYAEPPIGDLRFRAPVPAKPWKNLLDATKEMPKCLQKDYITSSNPSVEGSEDCLYLNVYTPVYDRNLSSNLLPVMVYIHPGGLVAWSAQTGEVGPEYLMDRNIVLITFGYRLGIFGFFSTLNDDAPGNWGLKDQVLALQWVQENIGMFGGDRNKVTIFGQSAGGASVHHLMLSPLAQGLFHQCISQSGAALNLFAKPMNTMQEIVFPLTGRQVGCDPSNTSTLVECLRKVDGSNLLATMDMFKYFYRDLLIPFTIVLETKTDRNPHPFLEREPIEIIESGEFMKVPWILGTVQNEGVLKSSPYILDVKIRDEMIKRFDDVMPKNLALEISVPMDEIHIFWEKLKEFYSLAENATFDDERSIAGFTELYTDRAFAFGIYQSALVHAMKGHSPIWFYNFNFRGSVSYGDSVFAKDLPNPMGIDFGVSHCDDLIYIFNSPSWFPNYIPNDTELKMSIIMIYLWTEFARTGIPHADWIPLPNLLGRNATNSDLNYLQINHPHHLEMRTDFRTKSFKFWTNANLFENIAGIN